MGDSPRSGTRRIALILTATLLFAEAEPATAQHEAHQQPIGLEYACDNRFAVTNSGPDAVTVTFRVAGTDERATASLDPAPTEDPHLSEVLIETQNRGTVELLVDGTHLLSRENGGLPCAPATAAAAPQAATSAQIGRWGRVFDWPIVAVHLHLLPDGRVLSFGKAGVPQIWDPATRAFTAAPSEDWLFCAGHAFLGDGRLLVAGGHIRDQHGLPDVNIYSAGAGWVSTAPMRRGRWYPTLTTMAYGQVVILAGRDENAVHVPVPEVWRSGNLQALTGARLTLPMYPRTFLAPNGQLFYAGEAQTTRYLDIRGTGKWTTVGKRRFANRAHGSAVMYAPGKVLYSGGGRTTNTAEVIDLNHADPEWHYTGRMAFARHHHILTVLPTGEVLSTGGVAGPGFNDLSKAVRAAEIWNPATGKWRTLASGAVPRGYHATSILLPDGRVLHAGSGDAEGSGAPQQRNAQLFAPPYLFAGPRPKITAAPATARYGTTFRVRTPDAADIARISLIRLGSMTHAIDMNQRYQRLSFTRNATGLTVTAPNSRTVTPPGHYMLFILNRAGVPSVAKIVQVRA